MDTPNYREQINQHLARFVQLVAQRGDIDAEIVKTRHLIRAFINMLPGNERNEVSPAIEVLIGQQVGLTDAIRNTLQQFAGTWMSAVEVKKRLIGFGFDFDAYTSNPLASIHTVLKRLPTEQVEKKTVGGSSYYRWKETKGLLNIPFVPGMSPNLRALMTMAAKGKTEKR